MATVFNTGKQVNWVWASSTIRVLYLQGSIVATGDEDFVSNVLATHTECNFTNYARQTLSGKGITVDDVNNKAQLTASNVSIASAGGATNNTITGQLVYHFVTNDADSVPIVLYTDTETTNGNQLTLQWPNGVVLEVL
jgi:hypothetical protein